MKKLISLLLVFCLLISLTTGALAAGNDATTYSDMVPKGYWSYDALTAALDAGLIETDGSRIRPYDGITRAEMATMVLSALGLNDSSGRDLKPFMADITAFTDVHKNDPFYDDIAMAYKLNLLRGSGKVMSPKGILTREQGFIVLCKVLELDVTSVDISVLNQFKDRNKISSWAKPYLAAMVSAGYVSGSAGILNPGETISRQQFAQVLYNLFKRNYISSQESANALSGKTLTGNYLINSDNITLANLKVNGDVIIGDGVGNGEVTLDHVTIKGRLIVRGGGKDSIYLKSTTASAVIIEKLADGSIRLHGDDGSILETVEIPDGNDTIIIECSVADLTLSGDDLDVVVNGSVRNVNLSGDNAYLSGSGSIGKVSLEEGVRKISISTANTVVVNDTGIAVTVIGKDGNGKTVSTGTSVTANAGSASSDTQSSSQPPVTRYTISFHSNGGGAIDPLSLANGHTLGDLPVPSKDNMIFTGWFTDDVTFSNGVTKDTQVYSNLDLYASYIGSTPLQESDDSTATSVMDVNPNYQITVLSSDATMTADDVKAEIKLETITEAAQEFGGITVTGSEGTYHVAATSGYTTGCSYTLTLNDEALTFKDESSSVRTYNITVEMPAPVLNLKLDSSVKFIPVTAISNITQNGQAVDSIFAPLYTMEGDSLDSLYGTFVYSGGEPLALGDKLAIYEGTSPDERLSTEDYTDEPISYMTVSGMSGSTISYGNTDSAEVIFTPDVLPVNESDDQDGNPSNSAITIAISKMTYTGDDYAAMGLDASTIVESGDFLAFYSGDLDDDSNSGEAPTYARIASVTVIGDYYLIAYEEVNESDVMSCMNMSGSQDLNYDQLSKNIDLEAAQSQIQQQVEESGFAEAAADYLVALAREDEGTRKQICDMMDIENFSAVKVPKSSPMLAESSGPKVNVNAKISKNLKHYSGDGLRAEVTVTCEVELGDNMKLVISGTFIEEFKVKLSISSKTIWKKRWIFPYIADFQVSANLDVYNYTYLSLNMKLYSESEEWSDGLNIKDSIDELREMTGGSEEANDKVRKFYELYQEMMSQEHGYFDLFDVKLSRVTGGIDPLHILGYGLTVQFVVSLDANVALGTEFGYEKATRYNFTLKIKEKSNSTSQTNLVDEQYSFNAYAMGELGIRAGIRITVEVGLLDVSLNSIGISAEVGAYWKIWGFVYYQLQHKNNVTTSQSSGACYMELGIYMTINFLAQLGGGKLASYTKTLYDQSWPLWSAGSQYYIYDFAYELNDSTDDIVLKGKNASYAIPSSVYKMAQMDFKTGDISEKSYAASNFTFMVKDDPSHVFSVSTTGAISVTPPANSDIATASLEVTWNKAPLSFTSVPVSRTYDLTWDNLASSYVINFNSNGGSNPGSIKATYGKAITLPTPTRAGYIFSGWYTDNGTFNNAFTQNTMPASNYTLYAKWTAGTAGYSVRHYQQTLDSSGYTLIATDSLSGTTGNSVTPNTKTYTGFTSPAQQTVTIAGDGSTVVSYYYTRNSYTLTFKPNYSGSTDSVASLKYGAAIKAPSFTRAGYNFNGWGGMVANTMPAQNLTYTAQWTQNTYTITYDLAGGSVGSANPGSYTVQSAAITLTNPTKAGYVFAGWTGTGLSASISSVTIPTGSTGNRYYTATWNLSSSTPYSVYHRREDTSGQYTILELEQKTGTTGENTAAQVKSYNGYTAGSVVQKAIAADGSTKVVIDYALNSYTLTFDANGGSGGTSTSVKWGTAISAPAVTRTGYEFTGWDKAVATTMPMQNLTYIAQWSPITYTITYDLAGGSVETANPGSYTIESTDIVLSNPTKTGYDFTGWTGTGLPGATPSVTISAGSVGNRNYTATWTLSSNTPYSVQHRREDTSGNYTLLENEALTGVAGANTAAQAKVYIGYTPGAVVQKTIAADGSTTVVIDYVRDSYSLTFNANGGTGGTSALVKWGTTISAPAVSRTGYTFNGWNPEVADTMPMAGTTYVAQWTANSYTVAFDKNGEDANGTMASQGFTYDSAQSLAANTFTRSGYLFNGWNTAANGSGTPYADKTSVTNLTAANNDTVVLYAQWKLPSGCGVFDAKYSAKYQVFDFIMGSSSISGNAFDSSWGTAGSSSGHQFNDTMLAGRYFTVRKTGDTTRPIALYLYESDGTPVVQGISSFLYANSLIGSQNNVNLTTSCKDTLLNLYGADWEKGLVAVGNITALWNEGIMFASANGFGYFISGKTAHTATGAVTLTNKITNPDLSQLDAVSDFESGPLTAP